MTDLQFTKHPQVNEALAGILASHQDRTAWLRENNPDALKIRTKRHVDAIRDIDWLASMIEEHAPTPKYPKEYNLAELIQGLHLCVNFHFDVAYLIRMVGIYTSVGALVETHLRDVIMNAILEYHKQQGDRP